MSQQQRKTKKQSFIKIPEINTNKSYVLPPRKVPSSPEKKQLRQTDTTSLCLSPKSSRPRTNFSPGLSSSHFLKIKKLGGGKFGQVYLVKHKKTGFFFGMKVIEKLDFQLEDPEERKRVRNQFIREVKIHMYLNHPNIAKLYGFFDDQINFYLVMELGCDGTLFQLMKKRVHFSQEATSILLRQILSATSFMHSKCIIHRDIKPQNIVLSHGTVKICDFGWSVYCPKQVRSTLCGTPLYLSPQILKGNKYNEKIDTWAIGTLSYELYTSQNPFKIKKKEDISKILTEDFVMTVGSEVFRSFVSFILRKDPNKRPDSISLQNHPFIIKFKELQTTDEICQGSTSKNSQKKLRQ